MTNENMKQKFIELLSSVNRSGIPELIRWLENESDFFTAPASTQHHGACEGGLLRHSLAVYENLIKLMDLYFDDYEQETAIICALLHDLCKANFYTVSTRNVKEDGVWKQVPYYTVDDSYPLGHGEKSVIMLQAFIRPTMEEIIAIRWHMGGYDDAGRGGWNGSAALSAAQKKYPLAVVLHLADMAASYLTEENE
nr:HD domain-containing protein [uncultured Anaeromusa sp.]